MSAAAVIAAMEDRVDDARELFGDFVDEATADKIVFRTQDFINGEGTLSVTPDDVAKYYAHEARNLSSGCRTLAGYTMDWRGIDQLANMSLEWFKRSNVEGMRNAGLAYGLQAKF